MPPREPRRELPVLGAQRAKGRSERLRELYKIQRDILKRMQNHRMGLDPLAYCNLTAQEINVRMEINEIHCETNRRAYQNNEINEKTYRDNMQKFAILRCETSVEMTACRSGLFNEMKNICEEYKEGMAMGPEAEKRFIELLDQYQKPARTRSKKEQSEFKQAIIDLYNSENPRTKGLEVPATNRTYWCPVVQDWFRKDETIAAHIMPYVLAPCLEMIFGKDSGPGIWSPRNGLLLARELEKLFDKFSYVIVPLDKEAPMVDGVIERWIVRVLNPDNSWVDAAGVRLKELDGRELSFRSEGRPCARYMYFRYVWALMKAGQMDKSPNWLINKTQKEVMWGTPGAYMRVSMLRCLARYTEQDVDRAITLFEANLDFVPSVATAEETKQAEVLTLQYLKDMDVLKQLWQQRSEEESKSLPKEVPGDITEQE